MKGFLYDLKRNLSGRFTIIMIILIVLLTLAVGYGTVSSSSAPTPPQEVAHVMPAVFKTSKGYNISIFAVNGYGTPAPGLKVMISLQNSTLNKYHNITVTTDKQGFYNTSYNKTGYNLYKYYPEYLSGVNTSRIASAFIIKNNTNGTYYYSSSICSYFINHGNVFYMLKVHSHTSDVKSNILTYFVNANHSKIPKEKLYYNETGNFGSSAAMTYVGTVQNVQYKIFNNLHLNRTVNNKFVSFGLMNSSNKTQVVLSGIFYSSVKPISIVGLALDTPYMFLIPLFGLFSAYFYYGKDKASGVLESVISKPVTKGNIYISRLFGSSITFIITMFASIGIVNLLIYKYTGGFLP